MLGFYAVGESVVGSYGVSAPAPVTTTISATLGLSQGVGFRATIVTANLTRINATLGLSQGVGFRATVSTTQKINATLGLSHGVGFNASIITLPPVTLPTWPDPSQVVAGIKYGPTGKEYTGTMVAQGGPVLDVAALVDAIWSSPRALSVARFQAMK